MRLRLCSRKGYRIELPWSNKPNTRLSRLSLFLVFELGTLHHLLDRISRHREIARAMLFFFIVVAMQQERQTFFFVSLFFCFGFVCV